MTATVPAMSGIGIRQTCHAVIAELKPPLTKTIIYTDALGRVTRTEVRNAAGAIVGETYPGRFEQALTAYNSLQDVGTYPKDGPLLTRPSS